MKISVLMPIYKTPPAFLREAINSILAQTERDFEFLIRNDSPEIGELDAVVASFADERIRFFRDDRSLGIAEAHNYLLDRAQGDFIALMDHDDRSRPERLARQLSFMEAHPEVGVCSVAYRRFGRWNKRRTIVNPPEDCAIRANMLFQCPILHPASMMRRQLLVEKGLRWDPKFISANDVKLYLDISRHAKLANLTDILYDYRMSGQQTSKQRGGQIRAEGERYHALVCSEMGACFSPDEMQVLNAYVLRGRCHVENWARFCQIRLVLEKLESANATSEFGDPLVFHRQCLHRIRSRFFKYAGGLFWPFKRGDGQ